MTCFAHDPAASLGAFAAHAGVGRVTLYGNFRTRAELVDALLQRVLSQANEMLDALELGGEPREDLHRLVIATWQIVNQCRALLLARPGDWTPP